MRILIVHNRYQQKGGEDSVVQAEAGLLRSRGHEIEIFEESNDSIVGKSEALEAALRCVYSLETRREVRARLRGFQPDLVHVHNFFPKLSPSVHYACHRAAIPLVQTLHNYRLLCPAATLLRDGKVCEDCMGKVIPWPAVQHGCYRQSRTASAAVANMLFAHRAVATWTRTVSRFIALTEFARQKFIAGGLPAHKIVVKPNFVTYSPASEEGHDGYVLFVGRLSAEKGIDTLLEAWARLQTKRPLKIVGEGPLASKVQEAAFRNPCIEWLGWRGAEEVSRLMARAALLVFPSVWYEGFPLVLAEAFAAGLPVIASRLGAMAEVVTDGKAGLLFTPGRPEELASMVEWAFTNPVEVERMRSYARSEYENKYTAESNYAMLSEIYRSACDMPQVNVQPRPQEAIV